jgi:hypothetical protein
MGQTIRLTEARNTHKISITNPQPSGRSRRIWEDNIKINLLEKQGVKAENRIKWLNTDRVQAF